MQPPRRFRPGPPIRGIAIHFCSCAVPCACMFAGRDMKDCNLVAVYRVLDGGYLHTYFRGAPIRDLTLIIAYRPAALIEDSKKLKKGALAVTKVLYVPLGLSENQAQALRFLHAEHLIDMSSGAALMRKAPIRFTPKNDGDEGYEVEIPRILNARTVPLEGAGDEHMVVENVPFREGTRWLLGRAVRHTYTDPEEKAWRWDLPNTNGAWCRFSWNEIYHP